MGTICTRLGIQALTSHIQKLSEKYPGVTIEVEWAVEFSGSGEGRYEYKDGKLDPEKVIDTYETSYILKMYFCI